MPNSDENGLPSEALSSANSEPSGIAYARERRVVDRPDPTLPGGIPLFLLALAALALVRVGIGYVSLPLAALPATNVAIAALFLAVPIVALFFAANSHWSWRGAAKFVAGGLVLQFGLIALGNTVRLPGPVAGVLIAVAQCGLACWCAGLGALLATLIREKNILLPIAIFLAAYDFFLVLTPWGYGERIRKTFLPVLANVAGQIPSVSAAPTHGLARPGAYVGMADFVFLAMFFIALFRFRMRTRQTLFWVLPALILYMLVVMMYGNQELVGFKLSALPAMVPIGLAVLIVNWREFQLKRDEKLATLGLAAFVLVILTFAATRPKPQAEPSPRDAAQGLRAPASSRG
ncbi:MAG: hypothetical protein ACHQ50_10970 [Fimbriimonadales bacterium]